MEGWDSETAAFQFIVQFVESLDYFRQLAGLDWNHTEEITVKIVGQTNSNTFDVIPFIFSS